MRLDTEFSAQLLAHVLTLAFRKNTYVCNITTGEKDLCDWLHHMAKQVIPESHELTLSNGCQSL